MSGDFAERTNEPFGEETGTNTVTEAMSTIALRHSKQGRWSLSIDASGEHVRVHDWRDRHDDVKFIARVYTTPACEGIQVCREVEVTLTKDGTVLVTQSETNVPKEDVGAVVYPEIMTRYELPGWTERDEWEMPDDD